MFSFAGLAHRSPAPAPGIALWVQSEAALSRSALRTKAPDFRMRYLSDDDVRGLCPAEYSSLGSPIPTQMISNGEFTPLPQTDDQRRVEREIEKLTDEFAPRHGMNRRQFLASSAGMAAAFIAMNEVFGPIFEVSPAEAQTPGAANQRAGALSKQFIIDAQTHFVRDDFNQAGLLDLAKYAKQNWNPSLWG